MPVASALVTHAPAPTRPAKGTRAMAGEAAAAVRWAQGVYAEGAVDRAFSDGLPSPCRTPPPGLPLPLPLSRPLPLPWHRHPPAHGLCPGVSAELAWPTEDGDGDEAASLRTLRTVSGSACTDAVGATGLGMGVENPGADDRHPSTDPRASRSSIGVVTPRAEACLPVEGHAVASRGPWRVRLREGTGACRRVEAMAALQEVVPTLCQDFTMDVVRPTDTDLELFLELFDLVQDKVVLGVRHARDEVRSIENVLDHLMVTRMDTSGMDVATNGASLSHLSCASMDVLRLKRPFEDAIRGRVTFGPREEWLEAYDTVDETCATERSFGVYVYNVYADTVASFGEPLIGHFTSTQCRLENQLTNMSLLLESFQRHAHASEDEDRGKAIERAWQEDMATLFQELHQYRSWVNDVCTMVEDKKHFLKQPFLRQWLLEGDMLSADADSMLSSLACTTKRTWNAWRHLGCNFALIYANAMAMSMLSSQSSQASNPVDVKSKSKSSYLWFVLGCNMVGAISGLYFFGSDVVPAVEHYLQHSPMANVAVSPLAMVLGLVMMCQLLCIGVYAMRKRRSTLRHDPTTSDSSDSTDDTAQD